MTGWLKPGPPGHEELVLDYADHTSTHSHRGHCSCGWFVTSNEEATARQACHDHQDRVQQRGAKAEREQAERMVQAKVVATALIEEGKAPYLRVLLRGLGASRVSELQPDKVVEFLRVVATEQLALSESTRARQLEQLSKPRATAAQLLQELRQTRAEADERAEARAKLMRTVEGRRRARAYRARLRPKLRAQLTPGEFVMLPQDALAGARLTGGPYWGRRGWWRG